MRYASFKKSRNIHVYLLLDIYLINKDHCDEAAKRLSFHLYAQILPRRSRFRRNRVKIPFGSDLVTVWNWPILNVGVVFPVLVLPTFQFPRFLTHFPSSDVDETWHTCSSHQYPGRLSLDFQISNSFSKKRDFFKIFWNFLFCWVETKPRSDTVYRRPLANGN